MDITWLGKNEFVIKTGNKTIAINPTNADKLGNLCLLNENRRDEISNGKRLEDSYIIDWPGEYEVNNILVVGVESETNDKKNIQTSYSVFTPEDISIGIIGNVTDKLSKEKIEKLGSIHILLVPIGADNHLKLEEISLMISDIEPRIIIPFGYSSEEEVDKFLKLRSANIVERLETFKTTKAGVMEVDGKVVILSH